MSNEFKCSPWVDAVIFAGYKPDLKTMFEKENGGKSIDPVVYTRAFEQYQKSFE